MGFAAVAILINVRKIDADLQDRLDNAAKLAQVTVALPLWNLDVETINNFADALLLDESLAFVRILSEGQPITTRGRADYQKQDFSHFSQSSEFLVKVADISYKDRKIGTIQLAVSREDVRSAIHVYTLGVVALTILVILAITLTSVIITRKYISGPLLKLQNSAGLIASGNLEAPIDTTSQDEIGHLAKDLNVMRGSIKGLVGELRESKETLEEYSRTLEQRVEARTRELTDALNELRALGELGRAISSSLDLQAVLTSIASHAVQLSGADAGAIYEYDDEAEEFRLRASHQMEEQLVQALRLNPIHFGSGTVGRAAATGAPVKVADILD